jgi:hypothetical protein
MRATRTFVVRLLVDPDEPQALRGRIHAVDSGEERPFADGLALLSVLSQMASGTGQIVFPESLKTIREGSE